MEKENYEQTNMMTEDILSPQQEEDTGMIKKSLKKPFQRKALLVNNEEKVIVVEEELEVKPKEPKSMDKTIYKYLKEKKDQQISSLQKRATLREFEREIKKKKPDLIPFPPIRKWAPELRNLSMKDLSNTIIGGVIVGFIVIPQAMAYCIMIGIPPKYGIYSAIMPGFIYAIFGSSSYVSVAPITTNMLMIGQAIGPLANGNEDEMVALAQCMAFGMGVFLLLLSVMRLGFIENLGYMSAAAFTIVVEQMIKMCRIQAKGNIFQKIYQFIQNISTFHYPTLIFGLIIVSLLFLIQTVKHKFFKSSLFFTATPLFITTISTLICYLFEFPQKYDIQTTNHIPSGYPAPTLPPLNYERFITIITISSKIGLVSFTESLLVAKRLGKKANEPISTQYEMTALGLCNFVGSFFNCVPSFGSISRSPINFLAGVKSPISGLISVIIVIFSIIFAVDLIRQIPIVVISAFVFFSGLNVLLDFKEAVFYFKNFKKDFFQFFATFAMCLIFGVADGLIYSIIISFMWILKRSAKPVWEFNSYTDDLEFNSKVLRQSFLGDDSTKASTSVITSFKQPRNSQESNDQKILEVKSIAKQRKSSFNHISMQELCLCHDLKCKKKCHIFVISLLGHFSYVNIKQLSEQISYLTGKFLKGFSLKGIIFECDKIRTIDISALKQFQEIIVGIVKKFQSRNQKFFMRFSQLSQLFQSKLEKIKFPKDVLAHAQKDTFSLILEIFHDLQKSNQNRKN